MERSLVMSRSSALGYGLVLSLDLALNFSVPFTVLFSLPITVQ